MTGTTLEERQWRLAQQWPEPRPELEAQWLELERLEQELERKHLAHLEGLSPEQRRALPFEERENFRRGLITEDIVYHVLFESGEEITETRNICRFRDRPLERFAPKARGKNGETLLPDFLCGKDGRSRYAEAKYKQYCSLTQKTNQYEQPIDKPYRDQYLRLQCTTGIPVFLFIWQSDIKRLFYRRLDLLGKGRDSSNNGDALVYWPVSDFYLWDGSWRDD